jgi:hypothetical protein
MRRRRCGTGRFFIAASAARSAFLTILTSSHELTAPPRSHAHDADRHVVFLMQLSSEADL